jgi:hypothetical protein
MSKEKEKGSVGVEFLSHGPGLCGWCKRQAKKAYFAIFSDGSFNGPLCKNDLLRAVEMKTPEVEDVGQPRGKAAANGPVGAPLFDEK